MERAAIVAAVIIAMLFAAAGAGAFHFNGWNFTWTGDAAAQVAVQPGQLPQQAYAAQAVRISDMAAIVHVTPEDRTDVAISVDNPGRTPMPVVRVDGDQLIVDGRLHGRILNCRDDGGVDLLGYGGVTAQELPVITLHVPKAVDLDVGGAVKADIAAAESVDLDQSGCGSTTVADLTGALKVDNSGSADVTAAAAASADLDLSGSGDIILGAISGPVAIDMAGAGSVTVASAVGLNLDMAGSGDVRVDALTGELKVDGAGSGDIDIRGGAVTLADISSAGSCSLTAPTLAVETAKIDMAGSGEVKLGAIGDLDVEIMGSGTVDVASVRGRNNRRIMGSGEVNVGSP